MITYKNAGVNIEEGYEAVKLMKNYAKETIGNLVLNSIGSFGAMFEIPKGYENPVLVSGTDGVGTKLDIASKLNKYDTIGIDCVAMSVNDILCHGARPLYFLDYIACGKLEANIAADIVKGVSKGCILSGASLIGGETAEMPGFYKDGDYDVAGFAVGIVEKSKIIDGKNIDEGDVLIGIKSSGIHSNGYSLVRKLISDLNCDFNGEKIGEILLTPTKIYVKPILELMKKYKIKGMSHITGGGFIENIPRMLPEGKTAVIKKNSYKMPEIFNYLMKLGVSEEEMYNTFNMGIGFVLCINNHDEKSILKALKDLGEEAYKIGYITSGGKRICLE